MGASNFMLAWVSFVGSVAMVAIIPTAFRLMLRAVKPAHSPKRVGAILGIAITLIFIPRVLVNAWSVCPHGSELLSPRLGSALGNGGDRDGNPGTSEGNEVPSSKPKPTASRRELCD